MPSAPQQRLISITIRTCAVLEHHTATGFFFAGKKTLSLPQRRSETLAQVVEAFRTGHVRFFGATRYNLGRQYDWVTNPDTGYRYDINTHWTDVVDFSPAAGDIKFVWEMSRFAFLYDLLRYDYHFGVDCGELVFRPATTLEPGMDPPLFAG